MSAYDIISLIGVILAFACMFITVYKGMHVVWATFLGTLIVVATNWMNLFDTVNLLFTGWGEAIPLFGPIVLFSAVFSKIMEYTGAARSFALTIYGKLIPSTLEVGKRRSVTIVVTILLETILVYAGLDIFAIVFMMLPILGSVCSELNIPRRYIPALILSAAGIACAIPGATNICNTIPMAVIGSYPMAGKIPGFVAAVVVVIGICWYLCRATKKSIANGENFDWGPLKPNDPDEKTPPFILALIPLVFVVIGFNVLNLEAYSLALASLVAVIVLYKYIPVPENKGAGVKGWANGVYDMLMKALTAIAPLLLIFLSTGFATVMSSSHGYEILVDMVMGISLAPAVTYGIIACLLVGIMINPMGGLMVAIPFALTAFPDLNPAAIHRISSYAYIVLDSLPFASGIILVQQLAGVNNKESYRPLFFTTVVWAFVGLCIVVAMYMINPAFA